jgi:hypothetical protein
MLLGRERKSSWLEQIKWGRGILNLIEAPSILPHGQLCCSTILTFLPFFSHTVLFSKPEQRHPCFRYSKLSVTMWVVMRLHVRIPPASVVAVRNKRRRMPSAMANASGRIEVFPVLAVRSSGARATRLSGAKGTRSLLLSERWSVEVQEILTHAKKILIVQKAPNACHVDLPLSKTHSQNKCP